MGTVWELGNDRLPSEPNEAYYRRLEELTAAPGAPEVFYAGETVAGLRVRVGQLTINPQKPPWGRGAIVFRVESRDAALAWVDAPAYTAFRSETAEDVVMLLEAGF